MVPSPTKDQRKKSNHRFGGLVEAVYKRDNYKCANCGMTMEEHLEKYHKRLTIDHINGLGRNSKEPDNRLENLITLCLPCHGKKDGLRTKSNQYGLFKK